MSAQLLFWVIFLALLILIIVFDLKYSMLRDMSTASKKPHSFSRVQLAWWSVIIFVSSIMIMMTKRIPYTRTVDAHSIGNNLCRRAAVFGLWYEMLYKSNKERNRLWETPFRLYTS